VLLVSAHARQPRTNLQWDKQRSLLENHSLRAEFGFGLRKEPSSSEGLHELIATL